MATFFGGWWRRFCGKSRTQFLLLEICTTARPSTRRAAEPLSKLTAPHGVYFVAGNHEQFGDDSHYLRALAAAGVRVLSSEKVEVDGLQILAVTYGTRAGGDW